MLYWEPSPTTLEQSALIIFTQVIIGLALSPRLAASPLYPLSFIEGHPLSYCFYQSYLFTARHISPFKLQSYQSSLLEFWAPPYMSKPSQMISFILSGVDATSLIFWSPSSHKLAWGGQLVGLFWGPIKPNQIKAVCNLHNKVSYWLKKPKPKFTQLVLA